MSSRGSSPGRGDFLSEARALFHADQAARDPRANNSLYYSSENRWPGGGASPAPTNRRLSNPLPSYPGADAPFSFLPRRASNPLSSERWAGDATFSAPPPARAPARRGPASSLSGLRDGGGELADLLKAGRDVRTTLGMHIAVNSAMDGLPPQHVQSVIPGGPAHLSGMIMRGDLVTHVDGVAVDERTIASHVRGVDAIGWPCVLTLRRGESSFNVKLHRVSVEWQEDMRKLFERLDELEVRVRGLAGSGPALDALQGAVMHVIDVERRRTVSEARLSHTLSEVQVGVLGRLSQLEEERVTLERLVAQSAQAGSHAAAGADREREARALAERVHELEGALRRAAVEREEIVYKLREERDALSRALERASREAEDLRSKAGGVSNVMLAEAGFSGIESVQQLGFAMKRPPETSVGDVVGLLRTLKGDPAFDVVHVAKMLHELRENTTIGPANVISKLLELEGMVLSQYHELQEVQASHAEGQKALKEAQEAVKALTERKERTEQGVVALGKELSALREAQGSWSAQVKESEGRAAELEAQLQHSQEGLSRAQKGRDDEVASLQAKLSDLTKKIDALRVDFVNKVADNEDLRRELDSAREELGVCRQSMGLSGQHAQKEVAEMKERLEKAVKDANETRQSLQADSDVLRRELGSAHEELGVCRQSMDHAQKQVAEMKERLEEAVKDANEARQSLQADNEGLRRELDSAREELGVCKQSMGLSGQYAQKEVAEMKERLEKAVKDATEARQSLQTTKERLEEAVKDATEARQSLQAALKDKESVTGALKALESAHKAALAAAEGANRSMEEGRKREDGLKQLLEAAAAKEEKLRQDAEGANRSVEEGQKREAGLKELLKAATVAEEKLRKDLKECQEREKTIAQSKEARSKVGQEGVAGDLQEQLKEANKRAELSLKKEAIARKALAQVMGERDKLISRVNSLLSQVERDRERCSNMALQLAAVEKETAKSKQSPKTLAGMGELAVEIAALRDELDGLLQHLSEIGSQDPTVLDSLLGVIKDKPAFEMPDVTEMLKSLRDCGSAPSDVILLLKVLQNKPNRSLEDACCIIAAYNQLNNEGGTVPKP